MRLAFSLVFFLLLGGCASAEPAAHPLPRTTIAIETPRGWADFNVEIANTQKEQELGLMFRTELPLDAGMLFDFHAPRFASFWMKNTVLPLDIIFVKADGTIATIAADAVPYSLTPIPSQKQVRAVIEINGGRSRALGIRPGARVRGSIFGG
jgi:uncharacterized membrane protein (UPF0127 family)